MPEQRCPMCGRPNPEANEECQHCGARLKPLVIRPRDDRDDRPAVGPSASPPDEAGIPEWLARVRAMETKSESKSLPPAPPVEPSPVQTASATPEPPTPTPPPAEPEPDGDDWLAAIRKQARPPGTAPLPPLSEPGEEPQTDWLARLRAQNPPVEPRFPKPQTEPAAEPPAAEPPAPERRARRSAIDLFRSQATPLPEALPPDLEPPPAEPTVPDWLQSIRVAEGKAEPSPAPPPATPAAPAGEDLPDWLRPTGETSDRSPIAPAAGETFDASPFDLPASAPSAEPPLPLAAADIPDWLSAMRPAGAEPAAPQPAPAPAREPLPAAPPPVAPPAFKVEPADELARATLPPWLEAMRPIAVDQPTLPDDDREEAAGPLAGMRGVLAAEPVIAMPRKPPVQTSRLQLTDVHAAQTELLRGLMGEEVRQKPVAHRKPFDIRLDRWLVVLVLLAATAAPVALGSQFMPSPLSAPREVFAVYDAVNLLPPDAPVLLAFEYGPSAVGELDAQARTVVEHLMAKRARLAVVSSLPAGAAVAQQAVEGLARENGYEYGQDYEHLGYLPGGSTGLLDLAIQPRAAIARDYTGESVPWDSPALGGVQALSDFRMIVVLASSPDWVRAWIEQVQVRTPGTPMIAVVSAGAEPLLRPYYESDAPQLAGMITGLNGAGTYEAITGRPSLARQRWDGYGIGLLVATGTIAVGNLIGAIGGVFRKKGKA